MIARLLRALWAAGLLAFALLCAAAWVWDWPLAVVLGLVALPLAGLGLVYAIEAVWMRRLAPTDPTTPPPSVQSVVTALVHEARHALPVFLWHQPRAGAADIEHLDAARHAGRTGLLLVHGYLCNAGFWQAWHRRLAHADQPHVAVTLEPPFADIDALTPRLDAAVRRLQAATQRPVVIVAHSMGGLVVRAWWRANPHWADVHVAHVVTLGTPHRGTALAVCATTPNGRQMRPDSAWLTALAAAEPPARAARYTCVHTNCDNVVFPPQRARMTGARSRLVLGAAHMTLTAHPDVHALVEATVSAAAAARPPADARR